MSNHSLKKYAWLSIAAAVSTITLKLLAYWLSNSVGLLSDALESVINFATAISTLVSLAIAALPPDQEHAYGHTKAEYFASGLTGLLIFGAGVAIIISAVQRWLAPEPLALLGQGVGISLVAAGINLAVARLLIKAGRENHTIALIAEGKHLMSDVWTTFGVALSIGLLWLTGWEWLDPLIAALIALQLCWTGFNLLRDTAFGLMDSAISPEELEQLLGVLKKYHPEGVDYHALRTRQSGQRRFVSVHLQVPGRWTVQRGHDIAEKIAEEMRERVPNLSTFTHIEPVEDPASWDDVELEPLQRTGQGGK